MVHLTGSDKTFDAIVWGPGEEFEPCLTLTTTSPGAPLPGADQLPEGDGLSIQCMPSLPLGLLACRQQGQDGRAPSEEACLWGAGLRDATDHCPWPLVARGHLVPCQAGKS